jgi:uncharacterized damage-inducible protein DinB
VRFDLLKSLEILSRTPEVLENLLSGLSYEWTSAKEEDQGWSVFDIVGHLIHGEKTDWMARLKIILSAQADKKFAPFDRFAQFQESRGKTLSDLLQEFKALRKANLKELSRLNVKEEDFQKTGIHPSLGQVTLSQLLSTWVAHDLGHIGQIVRVMAKQYKTEVGPWQEYLPIMHR